MRKILSTSALSTALLLGLSGVAAAGGSPGSLGVGAEYTLLGIGGASVNFDQGDFHAGGFFGYRSDGPSTDDENYELDLGGRFFYHLHSTAMSDFSLGGQLGLQLLNDALPGGEDATVVEIDLGAQIRVFVVSNVALSATVGLAIGTADAEEVQVRGNVIGDVGIHYYFF